MRELRSKVEWQVCKSSKVVKGKRETSLGCMHTCECTGNFKHEKKYFCRPVPRLWAKDKKTSFFKYSRRESNLSPCWKNRFKEIGMELPHRCSWLLTVRWHYIISNKRESLLKGELTTLRPVISIKCLFQGHLFTVVLPAPVIFSVFLSACHRLLEKA